MKLRGKSRISGLGLGIDAQTLVLTDPVFFAGQLPVPALSASPLLPAIPERRGGNLLLFLALSGAAYYFLIWRRSR